MLAELDLDIELNPQQKDIVLNSLDDSSVVLAGAGSGKTRVIIYRTQYLMKEKNVDPKEIVMVTFTNKAANEMKERLCAATPYGEDVFIGTFHNLCTTILREHGSELGFKHFNIMDKYASRNSLKEAFKECNVTADKALISKYSSKISHCKNILMNTQTVFNNAHDKESMQFARVFKKYQELNWKHKSFDFDDLIVYTVFLLFKSKDTRDWIQETKKYIVVDESQDMNPAQYTLLNLLAGTNNVCLVGDIDQSIYGFRDARPDLIEKFIKDGIDVKLFKLEQNYRSTKNIIEASNAVIKNNKNRLEKNMYCNNEYGEPIILQTCDTPEEEGNFIATEVLGLQRHNDYSLNDIAVLYRTNAQSRAIEDALNKYGIAYKMIGALSFYERKEIKDALALLKLYNNRFDQQAAKRILEYQTGIGKKTSEAILSMADTNGISYTGAFINYQGTAKVNTRLATLDRVFSTEMNGMSNFVRYALEEMGYIANLHKEATNESQTRLENLDELFSILAEKDKKNISIEKFLDEVSLSSTKDLEGTDKMTLMTIHSAKGLEFKAVFVVGMEEELLPHRNSMNSEEGIEEERRSAYVAFTRAKKLLYLSRSKVRNNNYTTQSRFVDEIPDRYLLKC